MNSYFVTEDIWSIGLILLNFVALDYINSGSDTLNLLNAKYWLVLLYDMIILFQLI